MGFLINKHYIWRPTKYQIMRKNIFIIAIVAFLATLVFLTHNVWGQEITRKDTTDITNKFPDPNFREALFQLKIIADPEHILAHEITNITKLDLIKPRIKIDSLGGIELFQNLRELNCTWHRIKVLDLSQNKHIEEITCMCNYRNIPQSPTLPTLRKIILPDNSPLKILDCRANCLTELDLSKCPNLEKLICQENNINSLNVNHCPKLTYMDCSKNAHLSELHFSKCTNLKYLNCSYCNITKLDVSNNINLENLQCAKQANYGTLFEEGRGGVLNSLIFPQYNKLKEVNCQDNKLTRLDIHDLIALEKLNCSWNKLTNLDCSKNLLLSDINCGYNYIRKLDFTPNTKIERLRCGGQGYRWTRHIDDEIQDLTELTIPYTHLEHKLKELDYNQSNLKQPLLLEKLPSLEILDCSANQLKTINLKHNIRLQKLDVSDNQLKSLDVSNNLNLSEIRCIHNKLKRLDIHHNKLLKKVTCIYTDNENKKFIVYVGDHYVEGSIDFAPNYFPYSLEKLIIKKRK